MRAPTSGTWLVLGLLALWEASARFGWVDSPNWPPVTEVLRALWQDSVTGELPARVGGSLYRMAAGLLAGGAAGVAVGLAFALVPLTARLFGLVVEAVRPIPIPAVIPPLVLFLGLDDPMKITVVALTVFFPVLTNTMQGVRAVEAEALAMGRTFGIGPWRRAACIVLPSCLPYTLAGLRVALGLALVVTVVAEMIAGEQGVGSYLVLMQFAGRAPEMYATVLLLAGLGYALNRGFVALEHRAIHWWFAMGR
ncbi:ABC transporter permease [Falsiroseomonas selenitidurans]|uniref:ABC transporter permease subunit n=1 Tax=Falsiroseomonas selenitidurans TaxID=2716335 RepID=A0ABX1EBQ8_9PROT|nr:ABC transporter permease subunit [Falsiroseomonas selenitidurans]NKC33188.1 ABC transporter permease subunit [Falsiroseomonas selenitidurans]